jgi:hypothetical protein
LLSTIRRRLVTSLKSQKMPERQSIQDEHPPGSAGSSFLFI